MRSRILRGDACPGLLLSDAEPAPEHPADRLVGGVHAIGKGGDLEDRPVREDVALQESADQAGLADSRPADDGHQVALAGSRPLERSSQAFGFAAAANERAEAARDTGRPAAALLHAVLKVIGFDRRAYPLDRDVAQRARRYVAFGQLVRGACDVDRARLGKAFHAAGEVDGRTIGFIFGCEVAPEVYGR